MPLRSDPLLVAPSANLCALCDSAIDSCTERSLFFNAETRPNDRCFAPAGSVGRAQRIAEDAELILITPSANICARPNNSIVRAGHNHDFPSVIALPDHIWRYCHQRVFFFPVHIVNSGGHGKVPALVRAVNESSRFSHGRPLCTFQAEPASDAGKAREPCRFSHNSPAPKCQCYSPYTVTMNFE